MLSAEKLKIYANRPNYSDIESVGFWWDVNSLEDIHTICSVVEDPETEEDVTLVFHDRPDLCGSVVLDPYDEKEYTIPKRAGSLLDGFRYWYQVGQSEKGYLSVHNCFTYDKPITEKVLPKCVIPDNKWEDTFIYSKIQYFDRVTPKGAKSAHGLQAYALRMGIHKPEITDFTKMDAFMLHRVIEDCRTQKYASQYLEKERSMCKSKLGIDFSDAYNMEVQYAKICHKQEIYGAKIDVGHAKACVEVWDKRLHELESLIEPQLPPTVKPQGQKVTRKEMAIALGFPENITDKMVEPTELVNRSGEQVEVKIKPYYKPSTNFHTTKKVNQYSGFHISYGDSPTFIKKNELTSWIKENYPDTKPKEWDIEKEIKETLLLNKNTCDYFEVNPEDTHIISGPFTRVKFEDSKLTQHEIVKGVLIKSGVTWAETWNLAKDVNGDIIKVDCDTRVSYPKKASSENQIHIDLKKGDALVTSPKFGDSEMDQVDGELGKQIKEYNTTMHRRRYLLNDKDPDNKGILAMLRPDGRVSAGVNNFNTATGRASHRVIVNLPSDSALLGYEMRKCVIADEGKELVGVDQKSSQLSIAAFVTNNTQYYDAVASGVEFMNDEEGNPIYKGTSAHCLNARYFNLVTKAEWQEAIDTQDPDLIHDIVLRRKKSKGLSFASLFGCGPKKLALMGGFSESDAKDKLKSFLDNIGLTGVIEFLETCRVKYKRGKGFYIPTAFGYWVFCEGMHKAVNYLIQSMEGAVQKMAVILFDNKIAENSWESSVNKILDMHDEVLLEVSAGMGVEVGKAMCEAYTEAGIKLNEYFTKNSHIFSGGSTPNITCDFAGGYAVGPSYAEVH
uniref:DNA-directed DNA polymerase family A palm domain-containing protein n=1 Tax=Vibrio phage P018-4 TaxID=3229728 RepID=A0AB39AJ39_9CAUD